MKIAIDLIDGSASCALAIGFGKTIHLRDARWLQSQPHVHTASLRAHLPRHFIGAHWQIDGMCGYYCFAAEHFCLAEL